MDTAIKQGTRKGRPNYSKDFKRRLAVAACAPEVSVSQTKGSRLPFRHDRDGSSLIVEAGNRAEVSHEQLAVALG